MIQFKNITYETGTEMDDGIENEYEHKVGMGRKAE